MVFTRKERVIPVELTRLVRRETRDSCIQVLGDTVLLLFRLDSPWSDLARGLFESSSLDGDRLFPSVDEGTATRTRAMLLEERPAPRPKPQVELTPNVLKTMFAKAVHFIAPLRRRRLPERPVQQQISVGRGDFNDLVLRDATVSNYHAWLECDEDGAFYLGDARSRNTTRVNDQPILRDLVALGEGDVIHFGVVQAIVCHPRTLWDALR